MSSQLCWKVGLRDFDGELCIEYLKISFERFGFIFVAQEGVDLHHDPEHFVLSMADLNFEHFVSLKFIFFELQTSNRYKPGFIWPFWVDSIPKCS